MGLEDQVYGRAVFRNERQKTKRTDEAKDSRIRLSFYITNKEDMIMAMTKERAYELVKELLEIEEAADSFNLTREERNELQQIIKDAMTGTVVTGENMNNITVDDDKMYLHVPTPEGELRAYVDNNPDCPAIMILLNPSDTQSEIDITTAEYSTERGLRSIIWGDAMDEDFTHTEQIKNIYDCRRQFIEEEMED